MHLSDKFENSKIIIIFSKRQYRIVVVFPAFVNERKIHLCVRNAQFLLTQLQLQTHCAKKEEKKTPKTFFFWFASAEFTLRVVTIQPLKRNEVKYSS